MHKTTILCQFGLFFVTSLLTHISINSQPFLVGIVSHTSVPLGQFLDALFAGSQSPIGQILSFPSHHEFAEGLKRGCTMAHRNITFVICDLLFTHCLGFFSSGRRRYLSFCRERKNHFSLTWIQSIMSRNFIGS